MARPSASRVPPRSGACAGMTLIEVLVSILIMAIAVVGVFSVVVSTTRSRHTRIEPHEDFLVVIESANDVLRNYVTADHGTNLARDFAPGWAWGLPGDRSSCGSFALATGCNHVADHLLPLSIRERHPGATLTYNVSQPTPDSPIEVQYNLTIP